MLNAVKIEAIIEAPIDCTDQQLLEWVRFELGYVADIPITNPLHEVELNGNVKHLYIKQL